MDLSRSDVDDRIGGVEERSSKDDGCIIFLFFYVQNYEVSRGIMIMYSYHDISSYPFRKSDWLIHHLQGNKDSSPNKYSYITLDIMLTPDPILQKVLWKILCPMKHSIVGTPGSSFLARNGEVRR
jgi:hypothetical protein